MTLHDEMVAVGNKAGEASTALLRLHARKKNVILSGMADALEAAADTVMAANAEDMRQATEDGVSATDLDRLKLTPRSVPNMAGMLRTVADLRDPIGAKITRWIRPNGLEIIKRRVPIGVVAMIFESQPFVTVSASAFCIKTANAVILRGGPEAFRTNRAIVDAMGAGGRERGMPDGAVQMVATTDRAAVDELVKLDELVDLVVPRGGDGLVRQVVEKSTIPVLKHTSGVCHTYVDESADVQMALAICDNAKCQRPAVCNAMETLLVHEKIAPLFLPAVVSRLSGKGVTFRGDEASRVIVPDMAPAVENDWNAEYLDLRLAVRIVPSVDAAVAHINRYGSKHADAVVANSQAVRKTFSLEVDSAAVFINSSTRFNDGACFGMGAEVGVSTSKLHARGPMGLEELTTYKYLVHGKGQVRE